MGKNYHYIYMLNNMDGGLSELVDQEDCLSGDYGSYDDVSLFLDRHAFEIRNSVVERLVEYAGRQLRGPYGNSY
ncbi:MAG: hypothetical protein EA408_01700 [Marinilabiliales bacterium]|nr:MAG: hypothetical protein EA408_01700 [Marinilabiliales bacterium]